MYCLKDGWRWMKRRPSVLAPRRVKNLFKLCLLQNTLRNRLVHFMSCALSYSLTFRCKHKNYYSRTVSSVARFISHVQSHVWTSLPRTNSERMEYTFFSFLLITLFFYNTLSETGQVITLGIRGPWVYLSKCLGHFCQFLGPISNSREIQGPLEPMLG